eukprot:CAMPEP_0202462448 /NCGR_PEP_ID=MMETSP1360-20130828/54068_1 /ASSEMBLY_ACC=CAM_ASM_000848 /TAXON_ID=515479 /ORGANISM="Licmophora paradoxa, Strain CCMP2313" /LENGTH=120 /DNA_ID=CAMNT_0049084937 /DNA_START=204 /DNA_END=562 /DNA_ORIENTATION=+
MTDDTSSVAPSLTGTIAFKSTQSVVSAKSSSTATSTAASISASSLSPKMMLATWYGQRPRNHQISKQQYVCWDDGGQSHSKRFTAVLVCPLTGEIFRTGKFGNNEHTPLSLYEVEFTSIP